MKRKKKNKRTPTQRSLKLLRDEGWICEKVERPWNTYTKRTQDLYDFGDILCFNDEITMIVQTTSDDGGNVSARMDKIRANAIARRWLASPHRMIFVHGWAKRGARGQPKLWQCRTMKL